MIGHVFPTPVLYDHAMLSALPPIQLLFNVTDKQIFIHTFQECLLFTHFRKFLFTHFRPWANCKEHVEPTVHDIYQLCFSVHFARSAIFRCFMHVPCRFASTGWFPLFNCEETKKDCKETFPLVRLYDPSFFSARFLAVGVWFGDVTAPI